MKAIVSVVLGAALALVSASGHAGFYCLKMPAVDPTPQSSKDDQIPVRFRIAYEIRNGQHRHKGRVFAGSGYALSADRGTQKGNYLMRAYKDSHACISMDALDAGLQDFVQRANRDEDGLGFPETTTARVTKVVGLPRSHKANCPPSRDIDKNVVFKVYRRSGAGAQQGLFDCGALRKGEDSPYAGIPSRSELHGQSEALADLERNNLLYQSNHRVNWHYILKGHSFGDGGGKPAHGGDASQWRSVDWGPALRSQLERYVRNCENPAHNLFCK